MRTVKLTQPDAWRQMPPAFPHPLRRWLTDRGSLTARIVERYPDFRLQRVAQLLATPGGDERRGLRLRGGEIALAREVLLCDGLAPLVFAHSVVAHDDLRGAWRGLSRLGSRPLAEMLFHDPLVTRLPMEYKKLDQRDALLRRATTVTGLPLRNAWARRSVFLKQHRPLLVTEVFLQDLRA